jgi:hypothetical protein
MSHGRVSIIWILVIRYCFEFRISIFEFYILVSNARTLMGYDLVDPLFHLLLRQNVGGAAQKDVRDLPHGL